MWGVKEKKFYVVWSGLETGVFDSWDEVKPLVIGVKASKFAGFKTKQLAEAAFCKSYDEFLLFREREKELRITNRAVDELKIVELISDNDGATIENTYNTYGEDPPF